MTDVEKLRGKDLDERSIKIWTDVQENTKIRESCILHEFEPADRPFRYRCKNCGCVEDGSFALAYKQGLEHGRAEAIRG